MMSEQEPYLRVTLEADGPRLMGMPAQRLGQVNLPEPLQTGKDVFAEWQWDGNKVIVRNCRYGFFPIFYYATENEFGVSPSVERLIECGAPADLDDAALATFLRLGFLVGEDTVFRAIRLVPPGGEICWNGGEPDVTGGYFFPHIQNLSRKAAIDGYGELFRQAVRRRASKEIRFGLPLSGGRDSRHILLELNSLGCKPDVCFTTHDFPAYREENIKCARLLSQRLNIPFRVLDQPGSRILTEIWKNKANSYGAIENTWAVNFYKSAARYTPIVYEGTTGDAVSAGSYLNKEYAALFEQGRIEELSEKMVERWLSWRSSEDALTRILTVEASRRFSRELAVDRVARELAKHTASANPISSFIFYSKGRRVAALQPFSIARQFGITAVTPYMDEDLLDFLTSLPPEMYMDKTFHTETIRRMHPEFNDIPYAGDKKTPLIESNWHYRRFFLEAGIYLTVNGRGRLVKKGSTVRRLLALAALKEGNLRMRMSWIAPFTVLYLAQLEKLCSRFRTEKKT
jgi:asparagine synthase (glutamine-hydrolysing)